MQIAHLTPSVLPYSCFAVWFAYSNDYPEVMKWTGSSWTALINGAIANAADASFSQLAIAANDDVFLAMNAYTNYVGYVYRLPAGTSTWEQVGSPISVPSPDPDISLTLDPKGTPYILLQDGSGALYPYAWDGSAWTQMGSSSPATADYYVFSMGIDAKQIVSFAYSDSTLKYPCYMQYY